MHKAHYLCRKIEGTTKQIDAKLGLLSFSNFAQLSEEQMKATLEGFNKASSELQKMMEENRYDALEAQKIQLKGLRTMYEKYRESKINVQTRGQKYSTDVGEDLRIKFRNGSITNDEINMLKQNPQYRKGMSNDEIETLWNNGKKEIKQKHSDKWRRKDMQILER